MTQESETRQGLPRRSEARSMASEMAEAHRRFIQFQQDELGLSRADAVSKANSTPSEQDLQRVLECRSEQVTWLDLDELAQNDPELWESRWEGIKNDATAELESGSHAASTVEAAGTGPWERAQFLALRDDFAREWKPQSGIEWTLIDMMAQSYTVQLFWQTRLTIYAAMDRESTDDECKRQGKWKPSHLSTAESVEQAAGMVDRFNRIFLRTLRSLRDLRRYAPTVIVQNANQVNVADQQVNVVREK